MGGFHLNISRTFTILFLLTLSSSISGCSSKPAQLPSPEERLEKVRKDMTKHRYEMAIETLEELKPVTAGTRLGGEVQFLMAETRFRQGKFAEADIYYGTYLDLYQDGPFAEKALYMNALSKTRNIRKIAIGLLTFRSYIPSDRDISVLREARILFELYIDRYPSGQWIDHSRQMATELLFKEGEHELSIASFYLKKDQLQAVLARAEKVLKGNYPEEIMTRARELVQRAGGFPSTEVDSVSH
jgi:outer membrane protein assembly factor BamD